MSINEIINQLREENARLSKCLGKAEMQYQEKCDEVAFQMDRAEAAEREKSELWKRICKAQEYLSQDHDDSPYNAMCALDGE